MVLLPAERTEQKTAGRSTACLPTPKGLLQGSSAGKTNIRLLQLPLHTSVKAKFARCRTNAWGDVVPCPRLQSVAVNKMLWIKSIPFSSCLTKTRELLLCRGTGRLVCTDVCEQLVPVRGGREAGADRNEENWYKKKVTQRQVEREIDRRRDEGKRRHSRWSAG